MFEAAAVLPSEIIKEAERLKSEGYRFVTLSPVEMRDGGVEVLYHFDRSLKELNLRVRAAKGVSLPSISSVYSAAFLAENEAQDLMGIRFDGLAVDYGRTLYLEDKTQPPPLCRSSAAASVPAFAAQEGKNDQV